ncbi:MAG: RNA polymerase sigma-70 factor [Prolixibacteraceae bacterium]|jgi:RNA polymerase sigma-70 factor (ECF subfamily)|nr:RNA polymerase sigma-70 factor [Prolixibacteraceae bacterium]
MKEPNRYTEQELVVLLQNNSPVAFQQLFDLYSQKLYHFSFSYLKSDSESEEIVQEVFLKIWEKRGSLKTGKSFKSYLFTIAFNAIRKNFNKKMKEDKYKHELFEWVSADRPGLESHLEFERLLRKLDRLIEQLPGKRKEIFLKRKKEGKSIAEIANEMGISPKTVKNQITEAMNSLRKSFDDSEVSSMLFYFLFVS